MDERYAESNHRPLLADIEPEKVGHPESLDQVMVTLVMNLNRAENRLHEAREAKNKGKIQEYEREVRDFKAKIFLRARDVIAAELETDEKRPQSLRRIREAFKYHDSYTGDSELPIWDELLLKLGLSTIRNIFLAADVHTREKVAIILKSDL